jgi:hypothetical protein
MIGAGALPFCGWAIAPLCVSIPTGNERIAAHKLEWICFMGFLTGRR